MDWAIKEGLLDSDKANLLWEGLSKKNAQRPQLDISNLFWYVGAALIFIAMGWLGVELGRRFGAKGVFVASSAYFILFVLASAHLWYKQHLKIPSSLLAALAVTMVPLIVTSFTEMLGYPLLHYLQYYNIWLVLETLSLIVGLIALYFFRSSLLVGVIIVILWALVLTATAAYLDLEKTFYGWDKQQLATLLFGLIVMAFGMLIDGNQGEDLAFWPYILGATAFYIGITSFEMTELGRFIHFLISLALMLTSVILSRSIFLVYGSIGFLSYLGHIAYKFFSDSLLFPFVLTLAGLAAIWAGVKYHKNRAAIDAYLLEFLPVALRKKT